MQSWDINTDNTEMLCPIRQLKNKPRGRNKRESKEK